MWAAVSILLKERQTHKTELADDVVASSPDAALRVQKEEVASASSATDPFHIVSEPDVTGRDVHGRVMRNDAFLRCWSDSRHASEEMREAIDCSSAGRERKLALTIECNPVVGSAARENLCDFDVADRSHDVRLVEVCSAGCQFLSEASGTHSCCFRPLPFAALHV